MSIKLNMSKTYDRVEWNYLKRVMEVTRLNVRLMNLIMGCVTSVSYSILVNGTSKCHIIPNRGLRQDNLLSLYLFLLYTEGLISLLNKATHNNTTQESREQRYPTLNHLLFAMTLCKANAKTNRHVQEILGEYEVISRQQINTKKIAMIFSRNTSLNTRQYCVLMVLFNSLKSILAYHL